MFQTLGVFLLDFLQKSRTNVCLYLQAAQAAIAEKAAKKCDKCEGAADGKKSFVDDETKAKLEDVAKKAEEVAKELAEQSADVAKAGFEGLKAGVDAAIKAYKENRNK